MPTFDAAEAARWQPADVDALPDAVAGRVPAWLLAVNREVAIAGGTFEISDDEDLSGLGGSLRWLTSHELAEEAVEFYPGIAALAAGFVPVAGCLDGSGDPYFIAGDSESADTPLLRIPLDSVVVRDGADTIDRAAIETVCQRVSELIELATAGG